MDEYLRTRFIASALDMESSHPTPAKAKALGLALDFARSYRGGLTIEFIQMINEKVLPSQHNNNKFRTQVAFTRRLTSQGELSKDIIVYCLPHEIHAKIERLIRELDMWSIESIAGFYVTFLDIHPFPNGNGRTMRVLFAWILERSGLAPPCTDLIHPYLLKFSPNDLACHANLQLFPKRLYLVALQQERKRTSHHIPTFLEYVKASLETNALELAYELI